MSAPGSARRQIAILNDDEWMVDLIRAVLEGDGSYDIQACTSAAECYRFVKEVRPELALLDVNFDGQPAGWSVLEQLKSDPETERVAIIMCTAADRTSDEHQALLDRYRVPSIPMPFQVEEFHAAVEAALASRQGPGSQV